MAERERMPDWQLERLALGELPAHEREALEARLAAEADGDERLAELRRSNEAILADLPTSDVVREIEARRRTLVAAERITSRRRVWIAGGVVAAAAAIVVLVVLPRSPMSNQTQARIVIDDDPTRPKGDPRLLLHRKLGDTAERLAASTIARDGDRIQLTYLGGGAKHGVIASLDGRGQVTVHFPDPGQPTRLRPGKVQLRHSYELDDAPEFERFLFITSNRPIDVELVTSRVRDLANNLRQARQRLPTLPRSMRTWSFVLRKGLAQ